MFWALVFFGPILLMFVGFVAFFNGARTIWSKPSSVFCWVIGVVSMAIGTAVSASGAALFDFVITSIK